VVDNIDESCLNAGGGFGICAHAGLFLDIDEQHSLRTNCTCMATIIIPVPTKAIPNVY
jgi:hypothetical protein